MVAADVCYVALCFGKIQVVGRKRGRGRGVAARACVGDLDSTRRDAGMKG